MASHAKAKKPRSDAGEPRLTDLRIETIAQALSSGQFTSRAAKKALVERVGCDEYDLATWAKDGRVTKRGMELFQARVFSALVDKWPMVEEAMQEKKSWAFRLSAQICTIVPVGGVSFQQNQFIDARVSGQLESTKQFARNFWQRVRDAHPNLQLVEAQVTKVTEVHDPPPDEEPEPEPDPTPAPEA